MKQNKNQCQTEDRGYFWEHEDVGGDEVHQ